MSNGEGLGIVTVASHQKVSVSGVEYGELKSAYVYPVSIDNKARYCALHGCTLVVGGPLAEAAGRSARWLKIAWLRQSLSRFQLLVWMDLDAIFAQHKDSLETIIDPAFDLHVTYDFGREDKINTGFFALKASKWSAGFLDAVWEHNDSGLGLSDQASINFVLDQLSDSERARRVKVYPRSLLNSFPQVSFIPVEDYQLPRAQGDEEQNSLVTHFAGQFGGARAYDGNTPPLMLLQFMNLLLHRHLLFLSSLTDAHDLINIVKNGSEAAALAMHEALSPTKEVISLLEKGKKAILPCLSILKNYKESYNYHLGIPVFHPPADSLEGSSDQIEQQMEGLSCDPAQPLTELRRHLSTILAAQPGHLWPRFLLCVEPASGRIPRSNSSQNSSADSPMPEKKNNQLLKTVTNVLRDLEADSLRHLADALSTRFPGRKSTISESDRSGQSLELRVFVSGCAVFVARPGSAVVHDGHYQLWTTGPVSNWVVDENSAILRQTSLAAMPPLYLDIDELDNARVRFWLSVAPLVLTYTAQIPKGAKLVTALARSARGKNALVPDQEDAMGLGALGVAIDRWVDEDFFQGTAPVSIYAEEVFVFSSSLRDDSPALHENELQIELAVSNSWRVAAALRNMIPMDPSEHRRELPLVVIACEPLGEILGLTCKEQITSLRVGLKSRSRALEGDFNGESHFDVEVVEMDSKAQLMDANSAFLVRRAAVLVIADAKGNDGLLLGLHGSSSHPKVVEAISAAARSAGSWNLPPAPLKVIYWHSAYTAAELPLAARALVSAGVHVLPLPFLPTITSNVIKNDLRAAQV